MSPQHSPILYRDNPSRWIERAEELRTHAAKMHGEENRRSLLMLAEQYYRMADAAEQRLEETRRFKARWPDKPKAAT